VIFSTLQWLLVGGNVSALAVTCVVLLPIGVWIGYDALRRGPILLLETSRGRRRLAFGGKYGREQLLAFVDAVNRDLGYHIEVDDSLR